MLCLGCLCQTVRAEAFPIFTITSQPVSETASTVPYAYVKQFAQRLSPSLRSPHSKYQKPQVQSLIPDLVGISSNQKQNPFNFLRSSILSLYENIEEVST